MWRALYSCIALLASAVSVAMAGPSDREENRGCGVDSLYHLLRCEGRSPTLERIQAILPRPQAQGHSFADVRQAADALGLTLDAVALKRTETSIDRPMLMFFRIDGDGRFAVVKPVGHTGRLVQVIDGDRSPTVLNFGDLARIPS